MNTEIDDQILKLTQEQENTIAVAESQKQIGMNLQAKLENYEELNKVSEGSHQCELKIKIEELAKMRMDHIKEILVKEKIAAELKLKQTEAENALATEIKNKVA